VVIFFKELIMFKQYRARTKYTVISFLCVLAAFILSDPDLHIVQNLQFGGTTIVMLLQLAKGILYVTAAHHARKVIFDYPEADFQNMIKKAIESPVGAGLAAIAMSLAMLAFTISFVFVPMG
jgi:hypothetical protein